MGDFAAIQEGEGDIQGPAQCVDNPEGAGVRVYEDRNFHHTPVPRVPIQCVDNPMGHDVNVYADKTLYPPLLPQVRPFFRPEPFMELGPGRPLLAHPPGE